MAQIGLKNIYYAIVQSDTATTATTYGSMVKLSNAVSVDINPEVKEATLYGDDQAVATNNSLGKIAVTIETADIPLEAQAHLLGHTIESDVLIAKSSDIAPYVGLAFESETHEGKTRCVKLLKGKFAPTQETINTRGEDLNYQVPKITGTFVACQYDAAWKKVKDYDKGASTSDWYTSF